MALDVENVVSGGVGGEELLRRARALETLHLALPPSGRQMRILGPIVLPSPALMQVLDAEIMPRSRAAAPYDRKSSVTNRPGA
jgi:hypothetical protein